ncbi:MAG TPA: thiamine pyrophosphate-binding protein, partial [Candidatus Eisenbacteria bacterium]|nr:thiamine pyrophosphate-binding protein [Candidatus Eisenbacteria bacterium]
MKYTGAEILIKTLIDEGVETMFGFPGGAVIDIYNALYD